MKKTQQETERKNNPGFRPTEGRVFIRTRQDPCTADAGALATQAVRGGAFSRQPQVNSAAGQRSTAEPDSGNKKTYTKLK